MTVLQAQGALWDYLQPDAPITAYARLSEVLKALPDGVDKKLVLRALRQHWKLARVWGFSRTAQRLPPAITRRFLATLARKPEPPSAGPDEIDAAILFLHDAVRPELDDAALAARWRGALRTLIGLSTSYAWGSKQKRATLSEIARGPFLSSVQAAVVGCAAPPIDYLGALAADGSEASADALLPHVHRALTVDGTRLTFLEQIGTHARPDGPIRRMLDELRRTLDAREAASPAHVLAASLGLGLGLGGQGSVRFAITLPSFEQNHNGPVAHCTISVDSRREPWFALFIQRDDVEVRRVRQGFDDDVDDLGLGPCDPAETPAYIARAATSLDLRWAFDAAEARNARGRTRAAIVEWLRTGRTAVHG